MYYVIWTDDSDVPEIITEIGQDGFVTREVGFDKNGRVVHKSPLKNGKTTLSIYGYFDLVPIQFTYS